jgi:hypothetical protein
MQGPNLWRFYVIETLATSVVQNINDTVYGSLRSQDDGRLLRDEAELSSVFAAQTEA